MPEELDDTTWHIVNAYRHLMTEAEGRAERAFVFQMKMEGSRNPALIQQMSDLVQEALNDPTAAELFRKGRVRLLRDAAQRILHEHADEVKRCGQCGAVLLTPKARQCFSCGYDWHGSNTGQSQSPPSADQPAADGPA